MSKLEEFHEAVGSQVDVASALQEEMNAKKRAGAASYRRNTAAPTPTIKVADESSTRAWSVVGEDKFFPIAASIDRLDPGCYQPQVTGDGTPYLRKMPIKTDALLTLPDSKSEAIVKEIELFASLKPEFIKRGLLFKRGILLWGPPGSGKTCTIHLLSKLVVTGLGGIAMMIDNPALASDVLKTVRKIEPERQIIAFLEDVDGLIENYGPSSYLALLDGEHQVDNIVFVATTNYPERLDKRFVDRPSRFDTIEFIDMPSPAAREFFLRAKEPDLSDIDIQAMVDGSDGFSIAHLRELIISTQCFKKPLKEVLWRLNANKKRPPNSTKSPRHVPAGFQAFQLGSPEGGGLSDEA